MVDDINFNFAKSCSLKCPFCYVPFVKGDITWSKLSRILDRVSVYNPKKITISGGDPSSYNLINRFVEKAATITSNIHLDTNFIGFVKKESALNRLVQHVKMFGIPLDGHNSKVHNEMRASKNHFGIVMESLNLLLNLQAKVQIHTMVSLKNKGSVSLIPNLIRDKQIERWRLFQFWPLAEGKINQNEFLINEEDFYETVKKIQISNPEIPVSAASIDNRHKSYFFINQNGDIYTVSKMDFTSYIFIGSIFSDNTVSEWRKYCV